MELAEILSQVKQVEDKQKSELSRGADPRILELKQKVTYIGRFVPYKDSEGKYGNTFVTWSEIGWPNRVGKGYIFAGRAPSDLKVKDDVVNKTQWEEYKKAKDKGDEVEMKATYKLFPQRKQAVNFYLTEVKGDDDAAKAKIGKVVILKYSAGLDKEKNPVSDLYKKVHDALYGDEAEMIGMKALDLSKSGISLHIKVTEKAGFNNYSSSQFSQPKDLGLTKAQIEEIHAQAHDLTEIVPDVKPQEELKKLLDDFYFGKTAAPEDEEEQEEPSAPETDEDEDNQIPGLGKPKEEGSGDDEIDSLIKGL